MKTKEYPKMDIRFRCLECGSDDIAVKYMKNLKTGILSVHDDTIYGKCFCNACGEWTTFGWMDKGEIQHGLEK